MARLSYYTPELAAKICEDIACGSSVDEAATINGITERCFFKWLIKYPELVQHYARAREIRADTRFESSSKLMNELRIDVLTPEKARIMLDELKWKCGKENAKKYGDSTQLKHADANGNKLSWNEIYSNLDGRTAGLPSDDEAAQ